MREYPKSRKYSTTNRGGYREYKSDPQVCCNCPTRHIWSDYVEMAEDAHCTPICQKMYKARKETIERVFADAKVQQEMRYTRLIALAQVRNWVKLKLLP